MQYVVNLGQVFSCQGHICDWRDRFLNYGPVWTALHQRLVIEGSMVHTISVHNDHGRPP